MCKTGSYKTHIKANYHLNCRFIKLENFRITPTRLPIRHHRLLAIQQVKSQQ